MIKPYIGCCVKYHIHNEGTFKGKIVYIKEHEDFYNVGLELDIDFGHRLGFRLPFGSRKGWWTDTEDSNLILLDNISTVKQLKGC